MINSYPSSNSKDFLRAVKKRLQSSKATYHEIELTIILLETASKNCQGLNMLISKKDFCQDVLYAVVSTKRGKRPCTKDIEDKVLNLIDNIANELEGGAGQTTPIYRVVGLKYLNFNSFCCIVGRDFDRYSKLIFWVLL